MNFNKTKQEKGSPVVAMIWSVVGAGFGQIYNDDVPKGVAFIIAAIVCWMIFWPLWIPVAVFSIYDAHTRAIEINRLIDLRYVDEVEKKNVEDTINATSTKVADFILKTEKSNVLHKNGLLTEEEYRTKISQLIAELSVKKPYESAEDFLTELIPLVKSEALNTEDITRIKALLY